MCVYVCVDGVHAYVCIFHVSLSKARPTTRFELITKRLCRLELNELRFWGPRADDCRGGGWVKHCTVQRRPPTAGQKFRKNGKYGATQAVRCGYSPMILGGHIYVFYMHSKAVRSLYHRVG